MFSYGGVVEWGFRAAAVLELIRARLPIVDLPSTRSAVWIAPRFYAEIRYAEVLGGRLRAQSWRGLVKQSPLSGVIHAAPRMAASRKREMHGGAMPRKQCVASLRLVDYVVVTPPRAPSLRSKWMTTSASRSCLPIASRRGRHRSSDCSCTCL